jgi:LuxR family transcriptional regulator, maltose regulon positive regulatory protein
MYPSLLATKIRIPPQRPGLVQRARLSDALERGIPDTKLALITAPAGYGKSTLLGQWARASQLRVAWLSLEDEDNDLGCFLRYLATAWNEIQPGIRETPVGLLLGSMSPDIDMALSAFINVGSEITDHTVLVLDDCHLISSQAVCQAIAFLIDHLAPTLHFAFAGRREPPLPLARYRARGEVLELGAEDLRFSEEETRAFLKQSSIPELAAEAIAPMQTQLEGWAAGLQLARYAVQRRAEAAGSLRISGKHRFIADYLHQEVLAHLDEDTRMFLLQTSILGQLHSELCDATTGRNDSQRMLETLERDGLFLAALDDTREWFRYHPLFAGVLREELHRWRGQEIASLHCRAAGWYLDHAMSEQAFSHALAGNNVDLVTRVGEDYCVIKLESGEHNVVARWLEMIPEDWFAAYPLVDLLRVAFLMFTGAFEESARILDDVEDRIRRSNGRDKSAQLAKVATVRCAIACFRNDLPLAEAYASEALGNLPAEDRFYRASIYHALGETYSRNACWDQARASFLEALNVAHEPSARIRSVHIYGALADLELRQGNLETAGGYWSKALEAIQEREMWGRLPIPVTGWVSIRMGELLYERNYLDDAWNLLARGLELAQIGGDMRSLIAGYLHSARVKLAEGDIALATHYLDRARPLLEQAQFPEWMCRYKRYQLELWLAQNRLRAVVSWADSVASGGVGNLADESEIDNLTLARALIVKGHRPDRERALAILRHLIDAAVARGRKGVQIEALALHALAREVAGDRAGALISLERALRLAEPEGYVRVFADFGLPMARLLQEAHARKVLPEYVGNLLEAFASDVTLEEGASAALPESLSEREREILGLIAAGLTNREIGEKLFISTETVKKHSGSIYAKLGVDHRTQAVARARELHILDQSR